MYVTPEPIIIVATLLAWWVEALANAYRPIVYGDVAEIVIEVVFPQYANAYWPIVLIPVPIVIDTGDEQ